MPAESSSLSPQSTHLPEKSRGLGGRAQVPAHAQWPLFGGVFGSVLPVVGGKGCARGEGGVFLKVQHSGMKATAGLPHLRPPDSLQITLNRPEHSTYHFSGCFFPHISDHVFLSRSYRPPPPVLPEKARTVSKAFRNVSLHQQKNKERGLLSQGISRPPASLHASRWACQGPEAVSLLPAQPFPWTGTRVQAQYTPSTT